MAAITQISRIQHRSGLLRELPTALNEAEFGWTLDSRQLYIGNGPVHPGNTEIITQHTPASSLFYSYKSPAAYQQLALRGAAIGTDPFTSSTGFVETFDSGSGQMLGDLDPTTFNPTIRSYQEKFDDVVNIKDYTGIGDGIADDTGAIIRASKDLFSEEFGAIGDNNDALKRNVALYFPAGVYRIRRNLLGFPGLTFVGDPGKTVIYLDLELSIDDNNDAVLISADSYGQVDSDMGNDLVIDGITYTPSVSNSGNMQFVGIIFRSNQVFDVSDTGKRQIVRLARTSGARFEYCGFEFVENASYAPLEPRTSLWKAGDSIVDATTAVLVTKANDSSAPSGELTFIGCYSSGAAHDINIIDDTSNVVISRHKFGGNLLNLKVGSDASYDYNPDFRHAVSISGSATISVEYSEFSNYTNYAIDVFGAAQSVRSFSNTYVSDAKSIRFGSATKFCSSMMDWFSNSNSASCGTVNPRIDNLSAFNTIFNAQDFTVIPNGIQELNVCGNIYITGSVISNPSSATSLILTTVAYPSSTNSQPNLYKGNSVIVNYAMNIPNGGNNILRTGTIKIIYTESSPGIGGAIQYSDDYVEVGGGNSGQGLALSAEFNNAGQYVEIKATSSIGTPTTKVIVSAISI